MRVFLFLTAAVAASLAMAEDPGEGLVKESSYKSWHLTIGPVMSPRVRVSVSGPRVALPTTPPAGWRAAGTGAAAPTDPAMQPYADRQYVDGYVKPDEGTADPKNWGHGLTWDWGAKDVPSQYSNGRMEFHTDVTRWTESYSSTAYGNGSGSDGNRDFLVGVEALGGWTFFNDGTFDATVDAGFRFYGSGYIDAESRYGTSVTTTHNDYRFVDSYDASGWTDDPVGSHTGTSGEGGTYGRVLGAEPTRREELKGSTQSTETYYYNGDTRFIYRIWDLRLGPTFGWQATDYLVIRSGVYGMLGLVDATLKTDANTSAGPRSASASTCGAVFGMAFGVSAQLYMTEDLFLYGGAEYDWWTDSVDLNAGGATADIKLSDLVISLGMGVEF